MLASSALMTDRYELTMLEAALKSEKANRAAVFEVFARNLAGERRYGVVAGTGRLLELISHFRFEDEALAWLTQEKVIEESTANWLANYKFSGNVFGYREGEIYFPYSPVLIVEGSFAEAVILETLILSVLNFDSSVASAAARMVTAASGRRLSEMGSRRTSEASAIAAARAAYIAGFDATSNLQAGKSFGIPTMGTASHAFTLLHDSEPEAFKAQIAAFGPKTTLLVDTYNIESGIRNAVAIAGKELGGVRIDSGDLPVEVAKARALLDSLGATETKITVTNDLNEFSIAALAAAPVDSYGVGTSVVTGSGVPAAGFVYKLVAYQNENNDWLAVSKQSAHKTNLGGRKYALRRLDASGVATAEVIGVGALPGSDSNDRTLLTKLISDGEINSEFVGIDGVKLAREHHGISKAELPAMAHRLTGGQPAIPTEFV